MFNLLMFVRDWSSGRVNVPLSRVFLYTEPHIVDRYKREGSLLLEELKKLPCLFCHEGIGDQVAYVGRIIQAHITGAYVALEINIDTQMPTLKNRILYENSTELDMQNKGGNSHSPYPFGFLWSYWAVKDVDLYRFLLRNTQPRRQHPTVFDIPEHESIEHNLVSVMMPFDASFDSVYEKIRNAVESMGLHCDRVDNIWNNQSIIQDVVNLIDRSRIVICDCTDRNANVFYEAGIAHTLGREVIPITQNKHDIPFDIQHLRYIHYHNNGEGHQELIKKLKSRMKTILKRG